MILKKKLKAVIFLLFVLAIPTAVFSSAPKQMTVVITSEKSKLYTGKFWSDPSVTKYEKTITINPSKGSKSINIKIKGFAEKVFFKGCPSGKKVKLIFNVYSKPNGTCITPFVKLPNTCQPTESCV